MYGGGVVCMPLILMLTYTSQRGNEKDTSISGGSTFTASMKSIGEILIIGLT